AAGARGVEEAQSFLARLPVEGRVGGAVDGEDVADEAVVGEVLEERLAPPLRVLARAPRGRELALAVVEVEVVGGAVVEPDVVDGQRDVVLDVERAVRMVGADAGKPEALG